MKSIALDEFCTDNLLKYSDTVNFNRAAANLFDGLKPVHRRILTSMIRMRLMPNGGFKKSARVVGDTVGKYHPHGTASVYETMVNMEHMPQKLIVGQGNWGDYEDDPAAERYTECKLSQYATANLLDNDYLKCVPMQQTYDGDNQEPVWLPAKKLNLLINGSSGIGVACKCEIPSFAEYSVDAIVKRALNGEKITPELCADTLRFNFKWGGVCYSPKSEITEYFNTGYGTLKFRPMYVVTKNAITVNSIVPSLNIERFLQNVSSLSNVNIEDRREGDKIQFKITIKPHILGKKRNDLIQAVEEFMTVKLSFFTLVNNPNDERGYYYTTIPDIIREWVAWRIELEKEVIQALLGKERKAIRAHKLILKAIDNLDSIPTLLKSDDPVLAIAEKMKMKPDEAETVYKMRLSDLSKLESVKITKKVSDCKSRITALRADYKNVKNRLKNQFGEP